MKTLTSDYANKKETKTFLFNGSANTINDFVSITNPKTNKSRNYNL